MRLFCITFFSHQYWQSPHKTAAVLFTFTILLGDNNWAILIFPMKLYDVSIHCVQSTLCIVHWTLCTSRDQIIVSNQLSDWFSWETKSSKKFCLFLKKDSQFFEKLCLEIGFNWETFVRAPKPSQCVRRVCNPVLLRIGRFWGEIPFYFWYQPCQVYNVHRSGLHCITYR